MPYKNSEKRKEKSRDAARSRRSKESDVFTNLSNSLPIPRTILNTLDKASIMRVAISHLKLRKLLGRPPAPSELRDRLEPMVDIAHMQSLDGVLMVIAREGDIVYLSENCCQHLGLTQIELIGQSIYEFTNEGDRPAIRDVLEKITLDNMGLESDFFMRLKCTLTSKGKNINLKSATYKAMHCRGHCYPVKDGENDKGLACLILVAQPISHPSNIEMYLDSKTLLTKHTLQLDITYCDAKLCALLGFQEEELKNRSPFQFYHAEDIMDLHKAFKLLKETGQVRTGVYRLLAKTGGYVYVQTEGTVIYNTRSEQPEHIVCLNYVISDIEQPDLILADFQMTGELKPVPITLPAITTSVPSIPIKEDQDIMLAKSLFALNTQDTVLDADDIYPCGPDPEEVMVRLDYDDPDPKMVSMDALLHDGVELQDGVDPASGDQLLSPPLTDADSDLMGIQSTASTIGSPPALIDISSSDSEDSDYSAGLGQTCILNAEEVDMTQRAPYISMTGDDDLVFEDEEGFSEVPGGDVPVNMDELSIGANINMTGKTEAVFSSLDEDKMEDEEEHVPRPPKPSLLHQVNKRVYSNGLRGSTDDDNVVPVKRVRLVSFSDSVRSGDRGGVLFNLLLGREVKDKERTYKLPPMEPSPYSPLMLSPTSSASSSTSSSAASSPVSSPGVGEKNFLRDLLTRPLPSRSPSMSPSPRSPLIFTASTANPQQIERVVFDPQIMKIMKKPSM